MSTLPSPRPRHPAPAPTGELRFADARLSTGVRLRYAEQGDPTGPTVILLHGYSDSWFSFSRVLPLLPRDLHVVALDQRGHGDSDRPASGYAMRDLAADALAFMDARGIAGASVVGHSMGSFVAQQMALAAPRRVERLVLVASGTTARNVVGIGELEAAVNDFDGSDVPAPAAFVREFQESTVHVPVPPAFMDGVVAESLKLPVRGWQALVRGMLATDVPVGLGAHRVPTLLLWGERDAYFPRSEQDALLRLLATATLATYPDTGHSPHWERPADVARDLAAFLTAAPPR